MMRPVFLRKGYQLIAGMKDIAEILKNTDTIPVDIQPLPEHTSLNLTHRCGLLRAHASCLKKLRVYKTFKKTTERQAQWLMHAGCKTWNNLFGEQPGGRETGLFMGLATVDCDDLKEMYCFENPNNQTIADALLRETNPLSGLLLLNTTICSHLATELQITGPCAAFSPHADAGAAAIIEAYYHTAEGMCSRALCGAGSQKITPWYFLQYEYLLTRYCRSSWFPSESAAFVGIESDRNKANGIILAVMRSISFGKKHPLKGADNLLSRICQKKLTFPQQIIYAGSLSYCETLKTEAKRYFPNASHLFLDSILGYAGPAASVLAVNLALDLLNQGVVIDQTGPSRTIHRHPPESVLVIGMGPERQTNYILIGGTA